MSEIADIVVVGAGVQGASLAFHLARRGADVLVLERETVASGATGRSSGFVRMHYDLESESRLAFLSFPYYLAWNEIVGAGDCGFVRTGFLEIVPPDQADNLRANVEMHRRIGIDTCTVGADEVAELCPGIVTDDVVVAAYEPGSGYADPTGTASGFLAAARRLGARVVQGRSVTSILVEGERVVGVDTDAGAVSARIVVDVAGAWAGILAETAGVDVPIATWRHDTAYFGLPSGRKADFPIVIDEINGDYFRPEGAELMLVGLEAGNEIGGSPDRPLLGLHEGSVDGMIEGICRRVPWMEAGTLRTAHGGQDGITPDQKMILGAAGPDGLYLVCGMSGTGFKTAPAIGATMTELILDGHTTTADISDFSPGRFAAGRPIQPEHSYGMIWR